MSERQVEPMVFMRKRGGVWEVPDNLTEEQARVLVNRVKANEEYRKTGNQQALIDALSEGA